MLDMLPMLVFVWLLLTRYLRENSGPGTADPIWIPIVTQNGLLQYTLYLVWCWLARLISHWSRTLLHSTLRQAERRIVHSYRELAALRMPRRKRLDSVCQALPALLSMPNAAGI